MKVDIFRAVMGPSRFKPYGPDLNSVMHKINQDLHISREIFGYLTFAAKLALF